MPYMIEDASSSFYRTRYCYYQDYRRICPSVFEQFRPKSFSRLLKLRELDVNQQFLIRVKKKVID